MTDQRGYRKDKDAEDHKQCCESAEQPYGGKLCLGVQYKWGCHKWTV